jgi:hypothetical protein
MVNTQIAYYPIPSGDMATFKELLKAFTDQRLNAYLEDPADRNGLRITDELDLADAVDLLRQWPHGRLFTPQADLRWERARNGDMYVVVITDNALPAGACQPATLTRIDGDPDQPCKILLWGQYRNGAWYEDRIPRLSTGARFYPQHWQGPYAAIIIHTYEMPLPARRAEFAGVRRIVRYIAYDGNFNPYSTSQHP